MGVPYRDTKNKLEKQLNWEWAKYNELDFQATEKKFGYDPRTLTFGSAKLACFCCSNCNNNWETRPNTRARGRDCPECASDAPMTREIFIKKSEEVHGKGTYDYSEVEYINSKTKVKIGCNVVSWHGFFEQSPHHHIYNKTGCPRCFGIQGLEDFIKKATDKHGDKFDYSEVVYTKSTEAVILRCIKHNVKFKQPPNNHLHTEYCCPECIKENNKIKNLKDQETFIQQAKEIHGNTYDYSEVDYQGSFEEILLTCNKGHKFKQRPYIHLRGYGCEICSGKKKKTNEDFINESIKVHGDKYDYSEVEYTWRHGKVKIGCPEHGFFKQEPSQHLRGSGCPECSSPGRIGIREEEFIKNLKDTLKESLENENYKDFEKNHKQQYVVTFDDKVNDRSYASVDLIIFDKEDSKVLVIEFDEANTHRYKIAYDKTRQEAIIETLKKSFDTVSVLRVTDKDLDKALQIAHKEILSFYQDPFYTPQNTSPEELW